MSKVKIKMLRKLNSTISSIWLICSNPHQEVGRWMPCSSCFTYLASFASLHYHQWHYHADQHSLSSMLAWGLSLPQPGRKFDNFKRLQAPGFEVELYSTLKLKHSGSSRGKDCSGRGSGRTWPDDGLSLTEGRLQDLTGDAALNPLLPSSPLTLFFALSPICMFAERFFLLAFGTCFLLLNSNLKFNHQWHCHRSVDWRPELN